MGRNSPTLSDIAARAGVGVTAVSAALRGSRRGTRVSEETRQRIMQAAADLRYSPNMIARGLKSQRFNSVGVTFPYPDPTWITSDYYGTSILTGIIGGSYNSGYNVMLFHKRWHDADQSAAGFRGQGIDGFLIVSPEPDSDMVSGLAALGIPLVVISSPANQYNVPSVVLDNALGVRFALDHLLALGHRRIAHLMDFVDQYDAFTRRDTFLAVLREAGIPVPPEYMPVIGNNIKTGSIAGAAYNTARRLLSLPEPPTAIFTTGDGIAMVVMEAARDLGISVPKQLSIVGFDDIPSAKDAGPPLTTIRQPFIEMGQAAARLLISLVEDEVVSPPRTHLFAPEFVIRESTAGLS